MIATPLVLVVALAAQPPTDAAASTVTVASVRNLGTAMMSWLVDQIADHPSLASTPEEGVEHNDLESVDWFSCPPITQAELSALLVPIYIAEVPKLDLWGGKLEFCLETQDFERAHYILGIRAPGRDGAFERGDYLPGEFDAQDFDSDILWLDGFFIRWPERATPP